MGSALEDLCGQLSLEELYQVVFGRWYSDKGDKVTTIYYSFDLQNIPQRIVEEVETEANLANGFLSLTSKTQLYLKMILDRWKVACGNQIDFQYVSTMTEAQPGIIFAACDNFYQADGIAAYFKPQKIGNNKIDSLEKVLVCLPPNISKHSDLRVISHEIGHALGINHLHDVESIKQRLQTTAQGLGCSVMPYIHEIGTSENVCYTKQYCENATFSVYPSPLDEQICTKLYEPILSPEYIYFKSMGYGLCINGLESFLTAFISKIKFDNSALADEQTAKDCSLLMTSYLQTLLLQTPVPLLTIMSVTEIFARWTQNEYLKQIQLLRMLTTTGMLLTSLYQLYSDDTAQLKVLYSTVMLLSGFCGSTMGDIFGSTMAKVTSSALDASSSLCSWMKSTFVSTVSSTSAMFHNSNYGFFSPPSTIAQANVSYENKPEF